MMNDETYYLTISPTQSVFLSVLEPIIVSLAERQIKYIYLSLRTILYGRYVYSFKY